MINRIDPHEFRAALSKFATGVTIVTASDGEGGFVGVTANSFNSASLNPPLVLWSLATSAHSLPAFQQATYFGIHILAAHQTDLALRFATRGAAKFDGIAIEIGPSGIPLLHDFAVRFVCRKAYDYDGGDHRILVGEVIAFSAHDKESLLLHEGKFSTAVPNDVQLNETAPMFGPQFLIYLLDRAYRQINAGFYQYIASLGISLPAAKLLALLSTRAVCPQHWVDSLGAAVGAAPVDVVDELTFKQLIVRAESPEGCVLQLTCAGAEMVKAVMALGQAFEEQASRAMAATEVDLLKSLLAKLMRTTSAALSTVDLTSISARRT